jgi:hypothetical protein
MEDEVFHLIGQANVKQKTLYKREFFAPREHPKSKDLGERVVPADEDPLR